MTYKTEQQLRDEGVNFDSLGEAKKKRMRIAREKQANRKKHKDLHKKANHFDEIVEEAISYFANERFDEGAKAVIELAHIWKAGGQDLESYINLTTMIEDESVKRSGSTNVMRMCIQDALRRNKTVTMVGK